MKNPSLLGNDINRPSKTLLLLLALFAQSGCAVVAVADAAVTFVAGSRSALLGITVDVAAAGIKATTGEDEDEQGFVWFAVSQGLGAVCGGDRGRF